METQKPEAPKKPEPPPVLDLFGRTYDLKALPAITLGDRITFRNEFGQEITDFRTLGAEGEAKLVHYALRKLHPETTYEEVLTIKTRVGLQILGAYGQAGEVVDVPTSASSTSSESTTDGAQKIQPDSATTT